jgi:hypothetical protein
MSDVTKYLKSVDWSRFLNTVFVAGFGAYQTASATGNGTKQAAVAAATSAFFTGVGFLINPIKGGSDPAVLTLPPDAPQAASPVPASKSNAG